jgi:hypothetical protein
VGGVWRYVYRAVDQGGQVIDVYVSARRDIAAARRFFSAALEAHAQPEEVVTDRAPVLAHVIADLLPIAFHNTERCGNNRIECDHGRLKARLRPMRGLKTDPTAEGDHSRSCLHTEPAPRALPVGRRGPKPSSPYRCGLRRTRRSDLIERRDTRTWFPRRDHRQRTVPGRATQASTLRRG